MALAEELLAEADGVNVTDTDRWLDLYQAAEHTRLSVMTIRREAKSGRLRSVKVGGRKLIRIRESWLDAWLENGSSFEGLGVLRKTES